MILTKKSAVKLTKLVFERSGSVRYPKIDRYVEGSMKYKKGFEIRLTVSEEELDDVNNALLFLGFYPGNPFSKGRKLVIPVYGTEDFIRFMKLIGAESYLEDESLK